MPCPVPLEPLTLTPLDENALAVHPYDARFWCDWQRAAYEADAAAVRESLATMPEQNRALALAMEPHGRL